MRRILSEVRGISPLIATLILVAATVAGGAIVYSVMQSQAGRLSGGGDFEVQSVSLIASNNIAITIKNTGSVGISSGSVTVGGQATTVSIGTVSPGQTYGGSGTTTATLTAGNSYVVKVSVTFADGSTATKAMSVTATG